MDVIELRRRLMMSMAKGAQLITGTITPQVGQYDGISFGKSISKYAYIIEMASGSKTTLMNSGLNANRTYAIVGMYPAPSIGNYSGSDIYTAYRINPTSGATSYTSTTISNISSTGLMVQANNASNAGANYLLIDYTYDYTIIPLD